METKLRDAYFAGLIDGEGGIYLMVKPRNGVRGNGIRPWIQLNMTCHETVWAIRNHFDCGTVRQKKTRKIDKPQWRWRVYYNDARRVALRILPFLITKRPDAERLLAHVPIKKGRARETIPPVLCD